MRLSGVLPAAILWLPLDNVDNWGFGFFSLFSLPKHASFLNIS
jgi:hypothetical protein